MPRNIYSVSFNSDVYMWKNVEIMRDALDDRVPYIHSEDDTEELFMEEAYHLYGDDKIAVTYVSDYIKELNEITMRERTKQAKYILMELAKIEGKDKELEERLKNVTKLTGYDFENLFTEFGPADINQRDQSIFINSESLEMDAPKELIERHDKTINYNDRYESLNNSEVEEKSYIEVYKALGFEEKDFSDMFENIIDNSYNLDSVKKGFEKVVEKAMKKIPKASRTEEAVYDTCNKFLKAYNMNRRIDLNDELTAYFNTKRFEDFTIKLTNPSAVSEKIADNIDTRLETYNKINSSAKDNFDIMINNLKRLEYVHSKRSLITRFVDWFKKDGELSTINNLKNSIMEKGHTKEEIENALRDANPKAKSEFDHYKSIDKFVDEINEYNQDGKIGLYEYVTLEANRKLEASRKERMSEIKAMEETKEARRVNVDFEEFQNEIDSDEIVNDIPKRDLDESFEEEYINEGPENNQ